jgi:hypothetical protein
MAYIYSEIKDLLDASSSFIRGSFPHSYICFDVTRPCNIAIKKLLDESGYWEFAPYRSKKLVYYHQIIAFLFVSKKKKDVQQELIVHHLSSNTRDNRPSNLVYLTEDDHVLVTKFQRQACTFKLRQFSRYKGIRTCINSKGTKVVNWVKFILGVIAKTVTATFNFSGMKYKYMLVASFKKIMKWAFKLINKIFNVQSDLVKVVV